MLLKVTFDEDEAAAIESLRGPLTKAAWVRQLVRQAGVAARVLGAEKSEAASESRSSLEGAESLPVNPLHQRPIIQKRGHRA